MGNYRGKSYRVKCLIDSDKKCGTLLMFWEFKVDWSEFRIKKRLCKLCINFPQKHLLSFIAPDKFDSYEDGKVTPLTGDKDVNKMKIVKEHYDTPYLKAENLEDTVVSATIQNCIMQEVIKNDVEDMQEGLIFDEYDKPLILNKTNLRTLISEWGDDTKDWIGKKVYLTIVDANNPSTKEKVKSIRISIPKEKGVK